MSFFVRNRSSSYPRVKVDIKGLINPLYRGYLRISACSSDGDARDETKRFFQREGFGNVSRGELRKLKLNGVLQTGFAFKCVPG